MKENKRSQNRRRRLAEKSRDNWKAKAVERRKIIKRLQIEARDKGASRDYWKQRAKKAEEANQKTGKGPSQAEEAGREGEQGTGVESFKGLPLAPGVEGTVLSPPKGHVYPLFVIQLGIQGMVDALMSVRADAVHFQLWAQFFTNLTPSFSTVRTWVFRLGLYELQREREHRTDWIWILDVSVQLGQTKCLVVLGISQARLAEIRRQTLGSDVTSRKGVALQHHDVEVLDMYVGTNFTGEVIDKRLEDLSKRVGCPVQIVRDNGSDVRKGTGTFVAEHEKTIHTYDVTHQLALIVKGALSEDERYQLFCQMCVQTAQQVQQTELYFLIPPAQRTKGRWLNVDSYVKWARNILIYEALGDFSLISTAFVIDGKTIEAVIGRLSYPEFSKLFYMDWREFPDKKSFADAVIAQIGQETYDRIETEICEVADVGQRRFDEKLGWVMQFEEDIESYAQIVEISHTVQEQVKTQGLHRGSASVFEQHAKEMDLLPRPQHVKEQVDNYLSAEGEKVCEGELLLGTTDTVESVFGKYKTFPRGPFKEMGRMLLTIPLFTVEITVDFVKEAMERIRGIDVDEWAKDTFGQSTLSKRRLAFNH